MGWIGSEKGEGIWMRLWIRYGWDWRGNMYGRAWMGFGWKGAVGV